MKPTIAVLLAAIALTLIPALTTAQSEEETIARISARPLADGRIEFAVQLWGEVERCFTITDRVIVPPPERPDLMEFEDPNEGRLDQNYDEIDEAGNRIRYVERDVCTVSEQWMDHILPRSRRFPADPKIGTWYSSNPPFRVGNVETRIRARRLEDGRTEFALNQTVTEGFWDTANIYPRSRYLSQRSLSNITGRWLNSTGVALRTDLVNVPIIVEERVVLHRQDLDGNEANGREPAMYYHTFVDPFSDRVSTLVTTVVNIDRSFARYLEMTAACYSSGTRGTYLRAESLPASEPDEDGNQATEVMYRFDSGPVYTEEWSHSSFANGDDFALASDAFVSRMRDANQVALRVDPNGERITVILGAIQDYQQTPVQPNLDYCGHY